MQLMERMHDRAIEHGFKHKRARYETNTKNPGSGINVPKDSAIMYAMRPLASPKAPELAWCSMCEFLPILEDRDTNIPINYHEL